MLSNINKVVVNLAETVFWSLALVLIWAVVAALAALPFVMAGAALIWFWRML